MAKTLQCIVETDVIFSEEEDLVAWVAERKVDEVVEEDPTLVGEVSRHHVGPCQEVVASRIQGVEAFLLETHVLVAWEVCLMVVVAWVALGEIQVDLVAEEAYLLVGVLGEGACSHPSCQEEGAQE